LTHQIEGGFYIQYMQLAMSLKSLKTTEIYTPITDVNNTK